LWPIFLDESNFSIDEGIASQIMNYEL